MLGLFLLFSSEALARVTPNPAGRLVLDPLGSAVNPATTPAGRPVRDPPGSAAAAGTALAAFVPVPLPAGSVSIDSTWYDLQDMGSLGSRIVITPEGRVHLTYQKDFCELDVNGCPPNPNDPRADPMRGMGYAYRSVGGVWNRLGKVRDPALPGCCVPELRGGHGTIAMTPDGRAVIAQHMNEDGCDLRGDFYLEDAPGGSTFTGYLTPIVSPSYLFPQAAALPNGSFVICAEVPEAGIYGETNDFRTSYLAAAGAHFVCYTGWQCGNWTAVAPSTLYRDGKPGFPCLAAASDGRAGIAVTDFPSTAGNTLPGNVFLIESSNGSFAPGTVTIRNLTNYTDAAIVKTDSTSAEYRPYIHCHLAYQDTTPHVVWSELQARRTGSSSFAYFDFRSRIRHWSSTSGVSTVYQVQPGEADGYDNIDNGLHGPLAGFNTITVDWPQVGFSADGSETYVAWLRFTDAEVDPTADEGLTGICTGVGFGDIACSLRRAGPSWSAPQNLTNTPSTDERFVSIAQTNEAGMAHIVFQASATNQAGVVAIGDRGTNPGSPVRRIAYLERPLTSSLVDVDPVATTAGPASLRAYPNPAVGRIRLALSALRPGVQAAALIYSVSGRLVARVPFASGAQADWNGRDRSGQRAPSGVYFARVEGDAGGLTTRFMLLH